MMIAALANAAFVFDVPRWRDAARLAFGTIRAKLGDGDRLVHSYRAGRRQDAAMLDDYAAMARAALNLFEATGDQDYVAQAERWVATANRHYWDDAAGGYFFTADDATDVPLRTKTALDTAVPSGNGMMVEVLARLFHLTGADGHRARAERTIAAFSGQFGQQFPNLATLASGYETLIAARQVVIVGDPERRETRELTRVVAETALPSRILVVLRPNGGVPEAHPAHGKTEIDGQPAAYVCVGPVCAPPATTPKALRERLAAR